MSDSNALTTIALSLIVFFQSTVLAQQQTPSSTEEGSSLQEVIVTATKRAEDVRKVPISMTVISSEEIRHSQLVDFTDLSEQVPGLSFTSQGGPGLSTLELRGVSSAAGSSTVGIYLDDVPITIRNLLTLGQTEPHFFDMERVEVLRGPQGTLWGASSEGGTIHFISNQPDAHAFTSSFLTEMSDTTHGGVNYLGSAVLNIPLVSGVSALRIGFEHSSDSGYIDQVSPNSGAVINPGINGNSENVVRVTLAVTPSSSLTLSPALFFQRVATDDIDAFYLSPYINPATNLVVPLSPLQTAKLVREPGIDTVAVPSFTVRYDSGIGELTSITSLFYRGFQRVQDATFGDSVYIGGVLSAEGYNGLAVNALPAYVYLNTYNHTYTQEFRLTSKDSDPRTTPLSWLVGVYYSDAVTTVSDNEPIYGITRTVESITGGLPPSDPRVLGFPFPGDNSYYSFRNYDEKQGAVFADLSYYLTPAFRVSGGVRYQASRSTLDRTGDFYFNGGFSYNSAESTDHAVTPRVAMTYDIAPNATIYSNIAEGYRLGGPNRPIPTSVCETDLHNIELTAAPTSFGADHLWNYEVGTKGRFFDNRLSVDLAGFLIKWSQIQQDVLLPICGYDFYQNVGAAENFGGELESIAQVTQHIKLTTTVGYTHATFTEAVPSLGVHRGDPIEGAPAWNGSVTGEYSTRLTDSLSSFVRINWRAVSNSHGELSSENPDYLRPGFYTTNGSAGLNFGQWGISAFVKNVFNFQKVIQRPNIQSFVEGITLTPRTFGIEASAEF